MTEQRDRSVVIDPSLPVYQARAHVENHSRSGLSDIDIYRQIGEHQEILKALPGLAAEQVAWWNSFVFCVEEIVEQRGLVIKDEDRLSRSPLVPPEEQLPS